MAQENNNMLYSIKTLTIPDYVLPMDVPKIINWFDYYNIANVKNVDIREHPEPEYYVEDKPYYGYAVIEIDEWYKNNSSLTFYEYLASGSAKMVYDDPYYWVVEFYEPRTQEEEVNNVIINLKGVSNNKEEDDEYYNEEFIEFKSRKRSRVQTRSMTKRTEDKSKSNLLNTEHLTLKDLIVKKNKNFNKREKRKPYKNEWTRRLRRKLEGL